MNLLLTFLDRSVIQLSAKAFKDPSGYFEEEDSPGAVRRYSKQLMKGILGREIQDSVLNEDISKVCFFNSPMMINKFNWMVRTIYDDNDHDPHVDADSWSVRI